MHLSSAETLIEAAADRSDPTDIAKALMRRAGWVDASVKSYEVVPGANPMLSQVFRVYIETKHEGSIPDSIIVKIPVANRVERRLEADEGAYAREAMVYEILAKLQGTNLPLLYASAIHEESKTSAMLLEDLGPPTPRGDWNIDAVTKTLVDLARLHSLHWEDDSLNGFWWMRSAPRADIFDQDPAMFNSKWSSLLISSDAGLYDDDELLRVANYLESNLVELLDVLALRPKTLSHGDLHQDNLTLRRNGDGTSTPVIIDFQSVVFGGATSDVAKFLGTAPDAALVSERESELLGIYHRALTPEIQDAYSFDQLARDYRLALLATFANYVICSTAGPERCGMERSANRSLRSIARLVEFSKPLMKLR